MKSIAIIPARGGSKRIPRKNIKDFLGKPIIAYSIEAARSSGCFEEVMVSTDDVEIAAIAKSYGARVPVLRSAKNADDHATTADVLLEVLNWYSEHDRVHFDSFCCIYPTAPFVTAPKLKKAKKFLEQQEVQSVIPVTAFSFPILRSLVVEEGKLRFRWPEHISTRSQDLPPAYHDSGQFYFVKTACFLKNRSLFTDHTLPMFMSELEVQDIDNESDWKIAELKYRMLEESSKI